MVGTPSTPTTTQSRYRQGTWTITKLKEELRNRNLSPAGTKTELIDRLERADNTGSATPKSKRGRRGINRDVDSPLATKTAVATNMDSYLTVSEIKGELRELGKPSFGNRAELLRRLEEAQAQANPFIEISPKKLTRNISRDRKTASVSPARRKTMARTPSPTKRSVKPTGLKFTHDDIGLLTSPITTLALTLGYIRHGFGRAIDYANKSPLFYINLTALLMLIIGVNLMDGPHQAFLLPYQQSFIWYGRWIILGILSSIGLGTGAHTFLLFLGPFIARVTTASYVCKSIQFPLYGAESLLCPLGIYEKKMVSIWMIMNKIKWEAFCWGLGTAIGELPPYLVARASAEAGSSSGEMKAVEKIAQKPRSLRTWLETARLASYSVVYRLGFWGILLCASIPNPFFDLAGITCGYFMIPFRTFALAAFLGKAIIKSSIQSAFVVVLFSREHLERLLSFVRQIFPQWGSQVHEWILKQREVFQERKPDPTMNYIGGVWHAILILMMFYFVVSVIRSMAIIQARRVGLMD